MHGTSICEVCEKLFKWRRENKRKKLPTWCSRECRVKSGNFGFRPGGPLRIDEMTPQEKFERLKKSFEKNVVRSFGCWSWKGTIDKGGYGIMTCNKKHGSDRAHRASWIIHKGQIPKGILVCHKCDHPECTNPDHLFLGTSADNTKDMIQKNRKVIGSKMPTSKLTEEKVRVIKELLNQKISYTKISAMFGVGVSAITRIKRNETWKHVGDHENII
jgi:hypothetical protein